MTSKLKEMLSKQRTLSPLQHVTSTIQKFSLAEKVIFYCLSALFIISGLTLLWRVSEAYTIQVPTSGGTLTEGVIGNPRFVNPLLASSDADKSLVALTYAGLVKENSDGSVSDDLAQSYTISSDGLTYTFVLRPNAKFSDGSAITADDVVFTIEHSQDIGLNSPYAAAFAGVTATAVSPTTVQITLSQAYAPFIHTMTIGILPKKIWNTISDQNFSFSQFNVKPIGAGPYIVTAIKTDSSGLPTEYDLTANTRYISGTPYISHIVMKFYQTETDMINAYNTGSIDAMSGVSPENIPLIKRTDGTIDTATLSRVFGIFWNESQNPVLLDPEVRQALDIALDKQALINQNLGGYAVPLDGPLPTDVGIETLTGTTTDRIAAAKNILEKAGWKLGSDGIFTKTDKKTGQSQVLSLTLSTSDAPELKAIAESVQATWTALGAKVSVQIFQTGDLNQNVIEPRKYDALLFGEVIPPGNDLYPFWDSSQRNDPGLNVALYANIQADTDLATLRSSADPTMTAQALTDFESQIASDRPAIFLYAPDFIYVVPKDLHGLTNGSSFGVLSGSENRYDTISSWYLQTDNVWKIFTNK